MNPNIYIYREREGEGGKEGGRKGERERGREGGRDRQSQRDICICIYIRNYNEI